MVLIRGVAAALFFVSLFGWFINPNALAVPLCFVASVALAVWSSFIDLDIKIEKQDQEHGKSQS
jgi:hypothetical protein